MTLRKRIAYGAATVIFLLKLIAGDVFWFDLQLDSETTSAVREAEKRWARQNHSAAEGHAVASTDADLFSTVDEQPSSSIRVE